MTEFGWKPVIWKDKAPKPIRRSDGKVLESPPPEQSKFLKTREEPQGEVIIDADERNTVRHVKRASVEQQMDVKTWKERKQEIVNDLNKKIGTYEFNNDELDDCIKMGVDVREVEGGTI